MFSLKNLTTAQAIVLVACLAAPIIAFKLLGAVEAGAATAAVGTVLSFLMGRTSPNDPALPPEAP